MLAEKSRNTNIGVGIGFVTQIVGRVIFAEGGINNNTGLEVVGGVVAVAGLALFIWGCVNYCQGKGYSGWLGLLGILSCIGLIVLVILPDKYKNGPPPPGGYGPGPGNVPPPPGVWPPPPSSGNPPPGNPPQMP